MRTKPNTRAAVAIAMATEDDTAFALIKRAEAIRSLDARDLVLEQRLRFYAELLRAEDLSTDREMPERTLNVHQPYAECWVTSPDGTRYLANPTRADVAEARKQAKADAKARAERRKTGVLVGDDERPRSGVVVLGSDEARAMGLGRMDWLAAE